eukprot:9537968-Karenia_brevis.AAC.1
MKCTDDIKALNSKQLPTEQAQVKTWLCEKCKPYGKDHGTYHKCDLCQQMKRKDEFTQSAWKHIAYGDRRSLCKECCNPVCTAPDCKTCKICRDVACKRRTTCTNGIAALHPKQLPTEQAQLQTWLCGKCKPQYCANANCRKRRQSKKATSALDYVC